MLCCSGWRPFGFFFFSSSDRKSFSLFSTIQLFAFLDHGIRFWNYYVIQFIRLQKLLNVQMTFSVFLWDFFRSILSADGEFIIALLRYQIFYERQIPIVIIIEVARHHQRSVSNKNLFIFKMLAK